MIKVLTAYGDHHIPYLKFCRDSIEDYAYSLIQYDRGNGKAWAMNKLLNRVKDDDVVGFLDADDIAAEKMFENAELLDRYDLVYGDVVNWNKGYSGVVYQSQPFNREDFKKKNFIPYSGVVAKGWLVRQAVYPDLYHGNDWNYWWRLLVCSGKFHYEPGVVAYRRTWTSYKRCDIPVYRKLKRLYYQWRVKQENKKYY